jgi:cobalamin biosynthesis protein CbiD
MAILTSALIQRDVETGILKDILNSNTTDEAVEKIFAYKLEAVFDDLALQIKEKLEAFVFDQIKVEVIIFATAFGGDRKDPRCRSMDGAFE